MQYEFNTKFSTEFDTEHFLEVDADLASIQAYLEGLAQGIRDNTARAQRYNHTWLQADSAVGYIRSLRTALQQEQEWRKK